MRGASLPFESVPPVWRKSPNALPPFGTRRNPERNAPSASHTLLFLIETPLRNTRVAALVMHSQPQRGYTLPSKSTGPLSHSVPPPFMMRRQW